MRNLNRKYYYFFTVVLVWMTLSCSNTRHLAEDETLYTGMKRVEVKPYGDVKKWRAVGSDVFWSAYNKPNNSVLIPRRILPPVRLWIYNYMETEKEEGFRHWTYKNFAREPVLISHLNLDQRARKLEAELFNSGYFGVQVDYELVPHRNNPKKAMVKYIVLLPEPYHIDTFRFRTNSILFDSILIKANYEYGIASGERYQLSNVLREQESISNTIRNEGYYFFRKDYLEFQLDTTSSRKGIDMAVSLRNPVPERARRSYTIGKINVYLRYSRQDSIPDDQIDTLEYDGIHFLYDKQYISPGVISKAIYFRSGDMYSQRHHEDTRSHLGNLGVFREILMDYVVDPADSSRLIMRMLLTPLDKITLSAEANVVNKSSGFAGPAFQAGITDENLKGGAEKLKFGLKAGFEWEIGGTSDMDLLGPNSYELGVDLGIQLPRILAPKMMGNMTNIYVPQTTAGAGFELLNRVQYYKMNSYNASFGYQWRTSRKDQHRISFPDLNIVQLLDTTSAFSEIYRENPAVRRSFEQQTILSLRYRYSYDNARETDRTLNTAWESGAYLAAPFAKFVKLTEDLRLTWKLPRRSQLVSRFYFGIGYPLADQEIMPYVEQFFSGGANSIRGFTARSVGPGKFLGDTLAYFDQTGDIKLEYNIEYRFRIGAKAYSAVFIDAGNIWLKNEDPQRPGSQFKFDSFYKEFAIGTGLGIRYDFSFFVIRLDLGIPLRNPGYPAGKQWVFNNKSISGANLFLAIGYPF